jgi:3-isopropylmalate/(R)-2-methylmalate dehydratase small subunit
VIARSFADIFRQNALKNGLLPIRVDAAVHAALASASPHATVMVDLGALRLPDGCCVDYPLDPFRKTCLAEGIDEIEAVLQQAQAIQAFEQRAEPGVGPV